MIFYRIILISSLYILGQTHSTSEPPSDYYIIWNVGYGQWHSLITSSRCVHIDLGGEYLRFLPQLLQTCQHVQNELILTHTDRHHLNFSRFYKKWLEPYCPHFLNLYKDKSLNNILSTHPQCQVKFNTTACTLNRFWVSGHTATPPSDCKQITTLAHHGGFQSLKSQRLQHYLSSKMIISTKQYRKLTHDEKTELLFRKHQRKIVYSYKWGHLIFRVSK